MPAARKERWLRAVEWRTGRGSALVRLPRVTAEAERRIVGWREERERAEAAEGPVGRAGPGRACGIDLHSKSAYAQTRSSRQSCDGVNGISEM